MAKKNGLTPVQAEMHRRAIKDARERMKRAAARSRAQQSGSNTFEIPARERPADPMLMAEEAGFYQTLQSKALRGADLEDDSSD